MVKLIGEIEQQVAWIKSWSPFNESLPFDKAFHKADIQASLAYAQALTHRGSITEQGCAKLTAGLQKVKEEWHGATFTIRPAVDEDIHTANERRLGEVIGSEIAGKLHTGRSLNEQIAIAMRICLREKLVHFKDIMFAILQVCVSRAEAELDVLMPGSTHFQRA